MCFSMKIWSRRLPLFRRINFFCLLSFLLKMTDRNSRKVHTFFFFITDHSCYQFLPWLPNRWRWRLRVRVNNICFQIKLMHPCVIITDHMLQKVHISFCSKFGIEIYILLEFRFFSKLIRTSTWYHNFSWTISSNTASERSSSDVISRSLNIVSHLVFNTKPCLLLPIKFFL